MSPRDRSWPPLPEPLPIPVVDNHTHLDFREPESDDDYQPLSVDEVMSRAASVNVTRVIQVGCDLPSARWTVQLVHARRDVYGAVALHPNETPQLARSRQLDAALAEIEELARDPRVLAVGESGLDHYRTAPEDWPVQEAAFRAHIDIAKRLGKVLQIHDRDAHDDVLRILEEEGPPEHVVLHCFSGDASMARTCVERGFLLSFAGTVTFKNARPLREALTTVPAQSLLVETDAPFLAPTPHRGRPNSPYLVPLTLRAMAAARGEEVAELARVMTDTTSRVYGIPWPELASS